MRKLLVLLLLLASPVWAQSTAENVVPGTVGTSTPYFTQYGTSNPLPIAVIGTSGATAGYVFTNNGPGVAATFQPIGTSDVGTLPVANGGTGQTQNANLHIAQKLAVSSDNFNLVRNTPTVLATIASPASAPSTTGFTNLLPSSNGGYVATFTGNTTSGSNVITNVSSTTALVSGTNQPLVEYAGAGGLYPVDVPLGETITSVNAGASTVTMAKNATATTTGVSFHALSDSINYIGGIPADYNNFMFLTEGTTVSANNHAGFGQASYEFMTDAANFSTSATGIIFAVNTNGGTPASYRVAIDDYYQSVNPVNYNGTGTQYVTVQFASAGTHKVRFEMANTSLLVNLWVLTGSQIQKPTYSYNFLAAIYTDSYGSTGGSGSWPLRNIAAQMAYILGWQPDFMSVAGTGYVANGTTNYNFAAPQRTRDVGYKTYNAIVVLGSVNDCGLTPATVQANALTTFQGLRATAPNAPIFVFGVPTTVNCIAANATLIENAVSAGFTSWGDTNAYFIPITTNPDGDLITTLNSGIYIAADGTHLTDPAGTSYYAYWMATQIKNILSVGAY